MVGLGVYFHAAALVGDGLSGLFGALVGLARYLVPIGLIVGGVALVHDGQLEHRPRIALGHRARRRRPARSSSTWPRAPTSFPGGYDDVEKAGGWLGAAIGEPLRSLLGSPGTVVLAIGPAGGGRSSSITRLSLKRRRQARPPPACAPACGPALGAAGRAIKEMTTLSSDKER